MESASKKTRVIDYFRQFPDRCHQYGVVVTVENERISVYVPILRYQVNISFKEHEVKRSKSHQRIIIMHESVEFTFSVLELVPITLCPKVDKPIPYLQAEIEWDSVRKHNFISQ